MMRVNIYSRLGKEFKGIWENDEIIESKDIEIIEDDEDDDEFNEIL